MLPVTQSDTSASVDGHRSATVTALLQRVQLQLKWLQSVVCTLAGLAAKYAAVIIHGPPLTRLESDLQPFLELSLIHI